MRLVFLTLLALLLLAPPTTAFEGKAVIYKNEACGHCNMYLMEFRDFLLLNGFTSIEEKLLINDEAAREELARFNQAREIPLEMQGHMTVVVDDSLVLEGHVPLQILEKLFRGSPTQLPNLVILQDSMLPFEQLDSYQVLSLDGKISECPVTSSLEQCVSLEDNKRLPVQAMLPLILTTGLLDGINPCAFGVLLFFVAFLYTLRRSRANILKLGAVYILMIFLTYFGIGLGILKAIELSTVPHLFAKLSAFLTFLLGLVNIKDYFWFGKGFTLKVPDFTKPALVKFTEKASLPAVIVLGFLVGLCTFPCSGGIYVAILALLTVQTTYLQGLAYMVVYNIMFVSPLIVILALSTNKRVVFEMEKWDVKNKRRMKLLAGLVMLGLAALLWVLS